MGKDSVKRAHTDLRKLQIGQVYDGTLDKVRPTYCLDLQRLYTDKKIKFSNDEVLEYYSFKDYSGENTTQSVLDTGGGVKGGGPMVSVAAAYSYYNEKASMLKENKLTAEIYKVKKVSIELINIENGSDNFIDYIDDKSALKADYEKIKKAKSLSDKKRKIVEFKLKWGTGLITKLRLMGGAMAEISFASKSSDVKSNTIHEAELSFESKFVSADGKLALSDKIHNFNLSVDMNGSVVSFPSEVKDYRDYVESQIKYLKEYIDKKVKDAKAPDFNDTSKRKPISAKDLNLIEPEDETPAQYTKRINSNLKSLEKQLSDPGYNDILSAISSINKLEEDYLNFKSNADLVAAFDDCKKDFKSGLDKVFSELRPLGEGEKILSEDALHFIDELDVSAIKNYKIKDTAETFKKLFNQADISGMQSFISANLKKAEKK